MASEVPDELLAFTERAVSRLAGVPIRQLREWANNGLPSPSVVRRGRGDNTVRQYSFADLVALLTLTEHDGGQEPDLEQVRARVRRAARQRVGVPGAIESRTDTFGGKPVFAGTRVPVRAVQAYIRRDLPDEEILAAYPLLEPADIEHARSLMRSV